MDSKERETARAGAAAILVIGFTMCVAGAWGLWGWAASVLLSGAFLVVLGAFVVLEDSLHRFK